MKRREFLKIMGVSLALASSPFRPTWKPFYSEELKDWIYVHKGPVPRVLTLPKDAPIGSAWVMRNEGPSNLYVRGELEHFDGKEVVHKTTPTVEKYGVATVIKLNKKDTLIFGTGIS